jgi:hypothetical protein
MRRAMTWLGLAACTAALLTTGPTAAAVKQVNGIGLIDYRRKPDFKVGDWVKYRITGTNTTGAQDDYMVTVIIAGEEDLWGEDGFWVETWTEARGEPPMGTATFMSYGIFEDSLPVQRMLLYQRKTINESDEQGNPVQVVLRRSPASLKLRTPFDDQVRMDIDTLGQDTVRVPRGEFRVVKVRTRQGKSTTRDVGDSTDYSEIWDSRTDYITHQIPITSVVREEIETTFQQRKWQIGRSEDAPPMRTLDHSLGEARLIDFGSGMKSGMLPESMQKSLKTRKSAEGAAAPKGTKPAASAPRKSG